MGGIGQQPDALVGLISDTHGVLDPRVEAAFAGVDAIIHAGDVCGVRVLLDLEAIAPVTAVAGNCDRGMLSGEALGHLARIEVGGVRFLAVHDIQDLGEIPADVDVIVCGHTHEPSVHHRGRVLVVNPGSASQRRRMPSRSLALLRVRVDAQPDVRIVMLDDLDGPSKRR